MLEEFKKFIFRGNVLDLAVGVVIGAAFTGIVNSLVNNIIMPIIGIFTAGIDFKDIIIKIGKADLPVGLFINSVVEFIIIAFTLFIIIKSTNTLRDKAIKSKEKEIKKEEQTKPDDIIVLEEIRDLLKSKNK